MFLRHFSAICLVFIVKCCIFGFLLIRESTYGFTVTWIANIHLFGNWIGNQTIQQLEYNMPCRWSYNLCFGTTSTLSDPSQSNTVQSGHTIAVTQRCNSSLLISCILNVRTVNRLCKAIRCCAKRESVVLMCMWKLQRSLTDRWDRKRGAYTRRTDPVDLQGWICFRLSTFHVFRSVQAFLYQNAKCEW